MLSSFVIFDDIKIYRLNIMTILNISKSKPIILIISIIMMYYYIGIYNINNNNNIECEIDGISLGLILLTTIIMPIIMIIRDEKIENKLFIIEILLIVIFLVKDILQFYIIFELILIPMFILLISKGSRFNKIQAGYKFFIYTILGSLLFLLSIIIFYYKYGTTNNYILQLYLNDSSYLWIFWILFFINFSIKIPIFPFHIWLPETHTEAPTTGSVILAAILLKLGIYGFIRFSFELLGDINIYFSPIVITFSFISIFYSILLCLRLWDIKKIIAYSSIVHMNYSMIGLYSNNLDSMIGIYNTLISHGIISSGLFILIGILYRRYKTRNILYYRGLSNIMPLFSFFLLIFILSNISLPLTSNFPGEFLLLLGIIENNLIIGFLIILGIFIPTVYNFLLLNKINYGFLSPYLNKFRDLSFNEFLTLLPLFLFNLFLGFYNKPFIDLYILSISKLLF